MRAHPGTSRAASGGKPVPEVHALIVDLEDVGIADVALVGGKNASLGELLRHLTPLGVSVPAGFAITAEAYRLLISGAGLEACIAETLDEYRLGKLTLSQAGSRLRSRIEAADFPPLLVTAIAESYRELSAVCGVTDLPVAVRSSATAEDLPDASFAGQQESFLNVRGIDGLLAACHRCFASLFTDRAIAYREAHQLDHRSIALSIGVQQMVRSDLAGSGIIFTLEPESGFPRVVSISATWGLGELIVQGRVDPDQYMVFKPPLEDDSKTPIIGRKLGGKAQRMGYGARHGTRVHTTRPSDRATFVLTDDEVLQLARWAVLVERHYGRPMDLEWAKDGETGRLFIVQARPETVHSRTRDLPLKTWRLRGAGQVLATGAAVGQAISAGNVCRIERAEDIGRFRDGSILVARMTDPDWVPLMRRAAGIVTDHGGPTSHAAIVSRELGVPAIVGTGDATMRLADGARVTLDCSSGSTGRVLAGDVPFDAREIALDRLPEVKTRLMINLADPELAFSWWRLPARGVGLARMEFIISSLVRVHPMALARPEAVTSTRARRAIDKLTSGFEDPSEYLVSTLALGIARIAAACYPEPAIVRLSDFKTNEYAALLGGAAFEPTEENPMLGFRGASRYYHELYREGFALECRALKRVRDIIGLDNVVVMIPFCRTPEEAKRVQAELAVNGLVRHEGGLKLYMMCEIPSNVIRAEEFAALFDGFSIGSNDLTQLVLGVDRDSSLLAPLFDERDPAVTAMIKDLLERARTCGIPVGICGQGPSNYPEFARFLVSHGIDSISLNPDRFVSTLDVVAEAEQTRG